MKARIVAVQTVLDVVVLMALGLSLIFLPLSLIWAFDDGFSTDLSVSWAAAVDIWLLGHGVPLVFSIPQELADSLLLGELSRNFTVDVALLGIGLLSVLWGYRMGRRPGTARFPLMVWVLAVGTLVVMTLVMVLLLPTQIVEISLQDALVRPALFVAAGLAIAAWVSMAGENSTTWDRILPPGASLVVSTGVRSGLGATFGLIGLAAVAVALVLVFSFATVISLYESLQPGVWGLVALTIAQLALLPTLIIWAASVMVGPGFTLGTGALVSPLGTNLQVVPALPILGVIPQDASVLGILIIAIPVMVAGGAGLAVASRVMGKRKAVWTDMSSTSFFQQPLIQIAAMALVAGLVAAGSAAVLADLASGQLGPGRFRIVGPDPGALALWWGLEVGIGVFVGSLLGALSRVTRSPAR